MIYIVALLILIMAVIYYCIPIFKRKMEMFREKFTNRQYQPVNNDTNKNVNRLPMLPLYMSKPAKCFDCEVDMARREGEERVTFAQPTKCFDCEKDLQQRCGDLATQFANPTKSFDSENQLYQQYVNCN